MFPAIPSCSLRHSDLSILFIELLVVALGGISPFLSVPMIRISGIDIGIGIGLCLKYIIGSLLV